MPVTVRIPTPMRKLTDEKKLVEANGSTIAEIITNLGNRFPQFSERICDENGDVRRFINIYLNDEDIRFLNGKNTLVSDGDVLSIIPAIAGGI